MNIGLYCVKPDEEVLLQEYLISTDGYCSYKTLFPMADPLEYTAFALLYIITGGYANFAEVLNVFVVVGEPFASPVVVNDSIRCALFIAHIEYLKTPTPPAYILVCIDVRSYVFPES